MSGSVSKPAVALGSFDPVTKALNKVIGIGPSAAPAPVAPAPASPVSVESDAQMAARAEADRKTRGRGSMVADGGDIMGENQYGLLKQKQRTGAATNALLG